MYNVHVPCAMAIRLHDLAEEKKTWSYNFVSIIKTLIIILMRKKLLVFIIVHCYKIYRLSVEMYFQHGARLKIYSFKTPTKVINNSSTCPKKRLKNEIKKNILNFVTVPAFNELQLF